MGALRAEVDKTLEMPLVLRGDGVATRLLFAYVTRGRAHEFLKDVLTAPILELIRSGACADLAGLVRGGEAHTDGEGKGDGSIDRALGAVNDLLGTLFDKLVSSPLASGLRVIIASIAQAADKRWPAGAQSLDPGRRWLATGVVFLRVIAPAIAAPENFFLVPLDSPSLKDLHRKGLTVAARVIQSIANRTAFGREPSHEPLNALVERWSSRLGAVLEHMIRGASDVSRVGQNPLCPANHSLCLLQEEDAAALLCIRKGLLVPHLIALIGEEVGPELASEIQQDEDRASVIVVSSPVKERLGGTVVLCFDADQQTPPLPPLLRLSRADQEAVDRRKDNIRTLAQRACGSSPPPLASDWRFSLPVVEGDERGLLAAERLLSDLPASFGDEDFAALMWDVIRDVRLSAEHIADARNFEAHLKHLNSHLSGQTELIHTLIESLHDCLFTTHLCPEAALGARFTGHLEKIGVLSRKSNVEEPKPIYVTFTRPDGDLKIVVGGEIAAERPVVQWIKDALVVPVFTYRDLDINIPALLRWCADQIREYKKNAE